MCIGVYTLTVISPFYTSNSQVLTVSGICGSILVTNCEDGMAIRSLVTHKKNQAHFVFRLVTLNFDPNSVIGYRVTRVAMSISTKMKFLRFSVLELRIQMVNRMERAMLTLSFQLCKYSVSSTDWERYFHKV